jgi:hypothetical protein
MFGGLTALLEALADSSTTALIGSVDPAMCETVAKLATHRRKSFITWSCPQVNILVVTLMPQKKLNFTPDHDLCLTFLGLTE